MMRAIVLVLCLVSAGIIAAYALYSRGDTSEPVYTVPGRSNVPPRSVEGPPPKPIDPDDRAALARELQRELKRVGCYSGEITGVWSTSSRLAMRTFIEHVNATLPVDNPDPVLLSLVQGHRESACSVACPAGQAANGSGACLPSAVLTNAPKELAPEATAKAAAKSGLDKSGADKTDAALAVTGAGAAAAVALAAPAAAAKEDAKARAPDAARSAAASQSGPPEGVKERRPNRSAQAPRPPKVVRDIMRALGIK